jgi:hypothetical protein
MTGENPYDDYLPGEEPGQVNSADPETVEEQERLQREERAEALRFWAAVLQDPVGRREIWRLLVDAGLFTNVFAYSPVGFPHPEATWFQAGKADGARRLYAALARDHRALVLQMHDEYDPHFIRIDDL